MKNCVLFLCLMLCFSCQGQPEKAQTQSDGLIGGPFENSEFINIGQPDQINAVDTSAAWSQVGQQLLITGTIFKADGKTPAPDVVLYYYHTDINGYYADGKGLDSRARRHGYIRGWVKSDQQGHYAIYTVRPAAYPNSEEPAHIHPAIKEPSLPNPYYLDAFVFDDDPLLTKEYRQALENRGGSGVLRVLEQGDLQIAEHNIILGLNIPNYPNLPISKQVSGNPIGTDISSFTPQHVWGPDRGSKACPICKYGRYHGILYFVGHPTDWKKMSKWLHFLEAESKEREQYLKVYLVYSYEGSTRKGAAQKLTALGKKLGLEYLALTIVPSFGDESSEINLNNISPQVENTFLLYRHSNIIDKYIDLEPSKVNFDLLRKRLNETTNDFFALPTPKWE